MADGRMRGLQEAIIRNIIFACIPIYMSYPLRFYEQVASKYVEFQMQIPSLPGEARKDSYFETKLIVFLSVT